MTGPSGPAPGLAGSADTELSAGVTPVGKVSPAPLAMVCQLTQSMAAEVQRSHSGAESGSLLLFREVGDCALVS